MAVDSERLFVDSFLEFSSVGISLTPTPCCRITVVAAYALLRHLGLIGGRDTLRLIPAPDGFETQVHLGTSESLRRALELRRRSIRFIEML